MKVLVAVKRVIASSVKVNVKSDQTGVVTDNVKMAMNDFDEVAVEQAVQLKEAGDVDEIVLVAIGPDKAQDTLRHGLAMGADRAQLIQTDAITEPLAVAKALQKVVEQEQPGLVFLGKQAIDNDAGQVLGMLAGLLDWPQVGPISEFTLDDQHVKVVREIDQGLQHLTVKLPAVFSVDLRLQTPRYANMPAIMKAKKKPLELVDAQSLGVDFTPQLQTVKVTEPAQRGKGEMVDSAEALVEKLKQQGVI